MVKGIVKWFNSAKGCGFIQQEEGNDVFVHFTDIQAHGIENKTLREGQIVRMNVVEGPKGLKAANVIKR